MQLGLTQNIRSHHVSDFANISQLFDTPVNNILLNIVQGFSVDISCDTIILVFQQVN